MYAYVRFYYITLTFIKKKPAWYIFFIDNVYKYVKHTVYNMFLNFRSSTKRPFAEIQPSIYAVSNLADTNYYDYYYY